MNAENNNMQTVPSFGEFIASVEPGRTVVCADASARFVWTGEYQNSGSGCVALLYDVSGNIQPVSIDVIESWSADTPIPPAVFRAAQLAAKMHVEAASLRRDLELARKEVDGLRNDVETINRMANDEADSRNMCSDYDDLVERINDQLTYAGLSGRSKSFDIDVDVTLRYSLRLCIPARNADDANSEVQNMTEDDIIRALGEQDGQRISGEYHYFDFEVENVRESDDC